MGGAGASDDGATPALVPLAQGECYAVIFTSLRTSGDHGYGAMADAMDALAAEQPGYLGHESARGADGLGITVSYWRDAPSVRAWKENARHLVGQRLGRTHWYRAYSVRIAKVERAYWGPNLASEPPSDAQTAKIR